MSRSGSAHANPDAISYTYNDRSELTGAQSNVDATYSYSYAYDPIGNRVTASEAGVPWTYTTNSLNQYTSATENNTQLSFAYDLDGNMTYRPVDATSGWTQVWNGENRMVETTKGADRLTFKYDYMGRRVEKCVYSGNTLTSKTYFVYDGFKCVEELNALNNTALMRHIWQPSDIGLEIILVTQKNSDCVFFLHDANKNVMQGMFINQIIQEGYIYTPFGPIPQLNKAHIGFSSEMQEIENDLVYYNFRNYNPRIGRWLQRDPLEEVIEQINRYNKNNALLIAFNTIASQVTTEKNLILFANNSPISIWDYLGLSCQTVRFNSQKKFPLASIGILQVYGAIASNTETTTCNVNCCTYNGKSISVKEQIQGSGTIEINIPTSIPIAYVKTTGSVFATGEIETSYDPCTNKTSANGCFSYGLSLGISGCIGGDKTTANACVGGEVLWSHQNCINGKSRTCIEGGFYAEACFLWRCYRWWFWKPEPKCW